MQTNCLLQQYVLAGQNPVSSYCLMPPLRFALLFLFIYFFQRTVAPYGNKLRPPIAREALSAYKPLNQYLSLDKRCQESFFFFSLLEDLKPSSKVLSCFYHSAIQRVLDIFFYVQQHLETLDRLVFSFSKDHRRKGRFQNSQD